MGFLEACVKPEALTAGFKEQGEKGYGLESGLYFIFRRLNSHPPPPTPFWTSVASFLLGCLWVFAAVIYSQGRCCLQEQEEEEEEEEDDRWFIHTYHVVLSLSFLTSSVLHQLMQLLGMVQKLHPPGTLTLDPAVHCFSCSGARTLRRQSEKYCLDPTFTYTLTQITRS